MEVVMEVVMEGRCCDIRGLLRRRLGRARRGPPGVHWFRLGPALHHPSDVAVQRRASACR